MKDKLYTFLKKYYVLVILFLIDLALLPLIYYYFTLNNLLNWDLPGHIAQIDYYKKNLLPAMFGWNNDFSLGYPQGDFYPPFWHYIIAVLCLIYNNPYFWLKTFFAVTLFALPFSLYAFFKSITENLLKKKLSQNALLVSVIVTMLVIILGPIEYGGTLRSLTRIGLINNFYSMPVFFFFVAQLISFPKNISIKHIFGCSLLLTILMMSHMVVGIFAVLVILFFWLSEIRFRNSVKELFKSIFVSNYFFALALTFFNTMFFFLPFIFYREFTTTQIMTTAERLFTLILLILTGLAFILPFIFKKTFNTRKYFAFLVPLLIVVAYCAFEIAYLTFTGKRILLGLVHPYRLLAFVYLMIPGLLTLLFSALFIEKAKSKINFLNKIPATLLVTLSIAVILVGNIALKSWVKDPGYIEFNKENITKRTDGYYYSLVYKYDGNDSLRVPIYPELVDGINIHFINALFAESTYFESFASGLRASLDTSDIAANKAVRPLYPDTYKFTEEEIGNLLSLWNVKYIIYEDGTKFKYEICEENTVFDYALMRFNNRENYDLKIYGCEVKKSLLRTTFDIKPANEKWDQEAYDSSFDDKRIIYSKPDFDGQGILVDESELKWSKDEQSFTFENANSGMQILPVQFSPKWVAHENSNHKNIQVYRLTPNLIGINEVGTIKFEYQRSTWENILAIISSLTFLSTLCGYLYLSLKRKN